MKRVVSVCVLALSASAASAQINVPIVNHSFEALENPPSQILPLFGADPFLPELPWQETGPVTMQQGLNGMLSVGLFLNSDNKPGSDPAGAGARAVFMSNLIDAQDPVSLYQVLTDEYQAGVAYELTAALSKSSNTAAVPTDGGLTMVLGFFDGPTFVEVGMATALGPAISATRFDDFGTGPVFVGPGQLAVGQEIVVLFRPDAQGTSGGTFEIDNVRLTRTPEPTTMVLLSLGGLAAVRRRR